MNILVVNCGSSSLKFQLIDSDTEQVSASGNCERIGLDGMITYKAHGEKFVTETDLPEHGIAIKKVLELLVDKEDNITEVAKDLKMRYKEVYTDEYQDTSYVQERILDAISKQNNRFMVGDIKQSIYGFRQARPDIFNDKYVSYKLDDDSDEKEDKDKEDSCKIILSKNFRSRKEVIDSINYIFEKIMSMRNGQCDYGISESLKCGNTKYLYDEDTSYKTQINQ